MKKLIIGLTCLAIASCKIPETETPITPAKLVFDGNFQTQNLQYLNLKTIAPERRYEVDFVENTMTIKKQDCENTVSLSSQEVSLMLQKLQQVRLCHLEYKTTFCPQSLLYSHFMSYYYKDAIDPDWMSVDVPRECYFNYGVCESSDIEKVLNTFRPYQEQVTCSE